MIHDEYGFMTVADADISATFPNIKIFVMWLLVYMAMMVP